LLCVGRCRNRDFGLRIEVEGLRFNNHFWPIDDKGSEPSGIGSNLDSAGGHLALMEALTASAGTYPPAGSHNIDDNVNGIALDEWLANVSSGNWTGPGALTPTAG